MEKIKQNPKKVFAIIAGVLFIAALLFMLLPGIKFAGKDGQDATTVSLFGLAFGGKIKSSQESSITLNSSVNALNLVSFILLILAIIVTCILIYGLISDKFSKKALIALTVIIILLVVIAAILTFACKNSALNAMIEGSVRSEAKYAGEEITEEQIQEAIKSAKQGYDYAIKNGLATLSLGAGAIVSPIMMLLGAGSLGGVICLSAKE